MNNEAELLLLKKQYDIDYLQYLAFNYFFWILIIPPFASLCYQFDGIFIGASQTTEMRNAMILAALVIFLPVWFLTQELENHGLWLAFYAFLLARSLFMVPSFLTILNKHQLFTEKN